jgi:peptidoglycan/LPS O-acetylase OafA/YrhL
MSTQNSSKVAQKKKSNVLNPSRIFYLDHLRVFIVILVVVLHCAMAYAVFSPPWTWVYNVERNLTFDVISLLSDNFLMPTLFFIAGFFSLLSLRKRNLKNFLNKRLMRLGIPYISGILIITPIALYIQFLSKNMPVPNYFDFWLFTYIPRGLNPAHLWFLLVLLFLTIGFSIVYSFRRNTFNNINFAKPEEFPKKYLIIFPLYTGMIFFIVNLFISDFYWIGFYELGLPFFNILQLTRSVLYIGFFSLGVYAFKNGWFSQKTNTKSLVFWSVSILILGNLLVFFYYFYYLEIETSLNLIFIRALLWSFFCFSMLIFLLNFFKSRFNKPSRLGSRISANSYAIYIIHLPLVVALQYWLIEVSLSVFVKFLIVFFVSLFVSYLISEYILRRIPGVRTIL